MRPVNMLLAALALAGCGERAKAPVVADSRASDSSDPLAPAERPEPAPTNAPASLVGEWRVGGIDGAPLNEPYGLALSADAATIWWEPRCAGLVRGYRIAGSAIAFGPDPARKPPSAGATPPPVCAIGLPARLVDVTRALDAATAIARTPSNGVELSGGGHSLLLFSQ